MVSELFAAACGYLEKGFRVVPTVKKASVVQFTELRNLDSRDPIFVKNFEEHPEATGIALIIPENHGVLDLDSSRAEEEFKDITKGASGIKTARGSKYLFEFGFLPECPAKFHIREDAEIILEGMLCELPPGLHKDGKTRYEWIGETELKFTRSPEALHTEILHYLANRKEGKKFAPGELEELMQGVAAGEGRNEAAIRIAGHLIGKGNTWETIENTLEGWNRKNKPPMSHRELEGVFKSARKMYDEKREEQKNKQPEFIEEISLSDLKNIKMDLNNRKLPDLMEILPPEHFINTVTTWMSGLSDTYYEYQVCSALWLLSALTQGKGALSLKQNTIYPNIYVLLLGQSTTSRKSTAVRKIKPIYEAATEIDLYNDDPTIEGYLEMLSKTPVQNFVRDEASGLLAKYHKKYNEGIFDLECNIYDGDSVRKIKAAGKDKAPKEFIIRNPYVTHLYATTPDKFASVMTMDDFMCGYGYRLMYAFPTYEKARMDFEPTDVEDITAWAQVMSITKTLFKKYNESAEFKFSMSSDAVKMYNEVGRNLEEAGSDLNNDQIDSAIGRAQEHILKIAMLIEIGKQEPSHEITAESISIASLMVIDFFLPSFMQVMDRIMTDIKINKIERAIAVIRGMNGTCTRSTLIKNAHFTKKECDEVIEAMVIGGILLERRVKETKAVTYILTTEAKTLELQSFELSGMFHKLRNLRKVRSFTSVEKNPAKFAKLEEINKDKNQNIPLDDAEAVKVPCEIAKFAKFANSAKSPSLVTAQEMLESWKRAGVV